jgi:hypothetical protein
MIDAGWLPRSMIPTLYAFGLSVHLPPSVAMALQMAGALAAGAATWTVWRKDQASFNVKAAVLCTSSMMVSPYMFHYDFVMLGLAVGFLMREGFRTGYFSYEGPILLAVWILPALVIPAFNVLHVQLGAAIAIMMLGILVRRMGHPQSA